MKKEEFLRELGYVLEGKVAEEQAASLLSEYETRFQQGEAEGRSEEEMSEALGSPARLGRSILKKTSGEEAKYGPKQGRGYGDHKGESRTSCCDDSQSRQYTDFQKKVNRAADYMKDRVIKPDQDAVARPLASMGSRFAAYAIDNMLALGVALIMTLFFGLVWRLFGGYDFISIFPITRGIHDLPHYFPGMLKNVFYGSIPVVFSGIYAVVLLMMGGVVIFSTLCLWLTNGYTPGKWLMKIRVEKLNGQKIRFLDAFFRECLIKGVANSLLKGFLNMVSFVWGCVTEDHKTVQDLAAQTAVIRVAREKGRRE